MHDMIHMKTSCKVNLNFWGKHFFLPFTCPACFDSFKLELVWWANLASDFSCCCCVSLVEFGMLFVITAALVPCFHAGFSSKTREGHTGLIFCFEESLEFLVPVSLQFWIAFLVVRLFLLIREEFLSVAFVLETEIVAFMSLFITLSDSSTSALMIMTDLRFKSFFTAPDMRSFLFDIESRTLGI